jgi:hypothetical protein
MVHKLYYRKQHNHGWISTLRHGDATLDCIPEDLAHNCPKYRWDEDVEALIQHLTKAGMHILSSDVPMSATVPALESPQNTSTQSGSDLLRHQADHATELLSRCPELWRSFRSSKDLKRYLGGTMPDSPEAMIQALATLDANVLQGVMLEVRELFSEVRDAMPESRKRVDVAEATVAVYLICVCLLIRVQAPSSLSGLPQLDSDKAANLFACLIGAVMAGGKLMLVQSDDPDMPVAGGAICVQLTGGVPGCTPKEEFERNLHTLVMLGPAAAESGLKVGKLDRQERANLIERLRSRRKGGSRTVAMSVLVFAKDMLAESDATIVTELKIPVFSLHHDIAYELLGGLSAERLVAMLAELWRYVSQDMRGEGPPSAQAKQRDEVDLNEIISILRALSDALGQHAASKEIRSTADELQRAVDEDAPPRRDVLAKTRETLDGLNHVGESAEKLIPRLLQLLNFFF